MIRAMRLLPALAATVVVASLIGCATAPRPGIEDFDTYHVVNIGPTRYVTPEGFELVSTGPGSVTHQYSRLPGSLVKVSVDPNPPRSLKLDADAEKRRFRSEIPNGISRSAQYMKEGERERVSTFVDGVDSEGHRLYGAMTLMREGKNTATVKVTGNFEDRDALTNLMESVARSVHLNPPPAMY